MNSTTPLKGSYSANIPNVSSAYLTEDFTGVDDVYVSFYLKVNALPSSDARIAFFSNQGTTVGVIVLRTTGALRLRNGSTTIGSDSAALTVGTLYRVGLHQKKGTGSNAVLEGYVATGDAAFGSAFASTTSGTWTTQADRFRFGATTGTLDGVFDNIRLDSGSMPGAGFVPGTLILASYTRPSFSARIMSEYALVVERPLLFVPPTGQVWRSYYYANGQRIAMRVEGAPSNNGVFYLLSDHLGSTSVTADATGTQVSVLRYYPYGQTRYSSGVTPTTYRYTGQRSDESSTGLYFYGARYYSSVIGRFISADTVVPGAYYPQAFNRYAYAMNDPLRYIDPSGHTSVCGFAYSDPECGGNGTSGATPTPTPTPPPATSTPVLPTSTPTVAATPPVLTQADVLARLGQSPLGAEILAQIYAGPGIKIALWDRNGGENVMGNTVSIANPNIYGLDVAAELLAHEATHVLQRASGNYDMSAPYSTNIEAEREAYLVGYTVSAQLSNSNGHQGDLLKLAQSFDSANKVVRANEGIYYVVVFSGCSTCDWGDNLKNLGLSQSAVDSIWQAAIGHP